MCGRVQGGWSLGFAGLALAVLAAPALAQKTSTPTERPSIYDESADARDLVDKAVRKAARDHSRVLVMFGGNWCGWCHKLHAVLHTEPKVRQALSGEYELVMVDTAAPHAESLMDDWKVERDKGVPYLVVLDDSGQVVARQETASLEEGDHHDPDKLAAFLKTHKAEPADAAALLDDALARAGSEGKRVLLHFGAPWCGWCHRLEDFLAQPEIAALMSRDYVDLKIDVDRMSNARDVLARFPGAADSGIPWMAILDPDGRTLINSFAEPGKGNIGYPLEPHEIAHFVKMLRATARNLDDDAVNRIESALEAAAAKIKSSR
jgi:thiol:disulfide interchange protein